MYNVEEVQPVRDHSEGRLSIHLRFRRDVSNCSGIERLKENRAERNIWYVDEYTDIYVSVTY